MKNVAFAGLLWIAGAISGALAEDTDVIAYLMREPVSLWDLGMHSLRQELHERRDDLEWSGHVPYVTAQYTTKPGIIEVRAAYMGRASGPIENVRDECEKLLGRLKMVFRVDPQTGKPVIGSESAVAVYFTHMFYDTGREPAGFAEHLDRLVTVTVSLELTGNPYSSCSAPLIGRSISFSR